MNKQIIVLVQSCRDDFFRSQIEVIKQTYASKLPYNIKFMYYDGGWETNSIEEDHIKLAVEDDVLHTYKKTCTAFAELLKSGIKFDYIVRTNTSTYLNIELLDYYIQNIENNKKLYCTELYSLTDGCCPFPLTIFARGNCLILSNYLVRLILNEGLNLRYLQITDDKAIGNVLNSYYLKQNINYLDYIECLPHAWYKCIYNPNTPNNHSLCKYGESNIDYSKFVSIQIKNYQDRSLENKYFLELHEKLLSIYNLKENFKFARKYSENPNVFIGSLLGYIDLETWKKVDKQQLYKIEVEHKASDDKLI